MVPRDSGGVTFSGATSLVISVRVVLVLGLRAGIGVQEHTIWDIYGTYVGHIWYIYGTYMGHMTDTPGVPLNSLSPLVSRISLRRAR
jgi:hypothetical protein